MQVVAQGWLVYRLTDSPFMLGLVNVVALVPVVPISLLAGVLSDRFPRRRLILVTELVLCVQALILALLTWLEIVQVWHIMVLSFGLGAAAALQQPARLAFVLDTVGKQDITNAVALNSSVRNAMRILGPALAGILVASLGEAINFFINSLTYLVVIGALLAIRLPPREIPKEKSGVGRSLVNGFQYIWETKVIRALMVIVAISSFFTLPYVTLMPVFAEEVLDVGAEGLGFLMAAVGAGAVVGALAVANVRAEQQARWLAWGSVLAPAFLILFTMSHSFQANLALIFLVAAANIVRQALSNSLLQIGCEEAYHGRVMSVFNLLFVGMSRAGALGAGAVAEFIGAPLSVGLGAVISLIWGGYVFWRMPHTERSADVLE